MSVDQHQWISQFLEMLAAERGAADNTLQAYRRDLDDFLAFLGKRDQALNVVLPADISAYMRALGPNGAEGANILALGDAVRALKRAGLEPDARRLAFEALFAVWPRTPGL